MQYIFPANRQFNLSPGNTDTAIISVTGVPITGISRIYVEYDVIYAGTNPGSATTLTSQMSCPPSLGLPGAVVMFDGTHGSTFNNVTITLEGGKQNQPDQFTPWSSGTYKTAGSLDSSFANIPNIINSGVDPNGNYIITVNSATVPVTIANIKVIFEAVTNSNCSGSVVAISNFTISNTTYLGSNPTLQNCFLIDQTNKPAALNKLSDGDSITGWGIYGVQNSADVAYAVFDLGDTYAINNIEIGPSNNTCLAPGIPNTNYLNNATVLYSVDGSNFTQALDPNTNAPFLFTGTAPGIYACYLFNFVARYVKIQSAVSSTSFLGLSRFRVFGSLTTTSTTSTTTTAPGPVTSTTTTTAAPAPPAIPIHVYDFNNRLIDVNTTYPLSSQNGPLDLADNNVSIDQFYQNPTYVGGRVNSTFGGIRFPAPQSGNNGRIYSTNGNLNPTTITFWFKFSTGTWADGPTGPLGAILRVEPRTILKLNNSTLPVDSFTLNLGIYNNYLYLSSSNDGINVTSKNIAGLSVTNTTGICYQQWYFVVLRQGTGYPAVVDVQVWRQNGTLLNQTTMSLAGGSAADRLELGGWFFTSGYYGGVAHDIADLRIFNNYINDSQISQIYNQGYGTSVTVSDPSDWKCPVHHLNFANSLTDVGFGRLLNVSWTAPNNIIFPTSAFLNHTASIVTTNGINAIQGIEGTRGALLSWDSGNFTDFFVSCWAHISPPTLTSTNVQLIRCYVKTGTSELTVFKLYRSNSTIYLDYIKTLNTNATASCVALNGVGAGGAPINTWNSYIIRYSHFSNSITVYINGVPRITVKALITISNSWNTVPGIIEFGANAGAQSNTYTMLFGDLRIINSVIDNNGPLNNISSLIVKNIYNNASGTTITCSDGTTSTTTGAPANIQAALHYYPLTGDLGDRYRATVDQPYPLTVTGEPLDFTSNVNGPLNYDTVTVTGKSALRLAIANSLDPSEVNHSIRIWSGSAINTTDSGPNQPFTIQFWARFDCTPGQWNLDNLLYLSNGNVANGIGIYYDKSANSLCLSLWDQKYEASDRVIAPVDTNQYGGPKFIVNHWYFFNLTVHTDSTGCIVTLDVFGPNLAISQVRTYSAQRIWGINLVWFNLPSIGYTQNVDRGLNNQQALALSDIAIFDSLIFTTKANYIYNNGLGRSWSTTNNVVWMADINCPVHCFPFDDNFLDVSNRVAHNIQYTPMVLSSFGNVNFAPALINDGISYQQVNSSEPIGYVTSDTPLINLLSNNIFGGLSFAISFWFKNTQFNATNDFSAVHSTDSAFTLQGYTSPYTNQPFNIVTITSNGNALLLRGSSETSQITSGWNHLVVNYDDAVNRFVVYLNGQPTAEDPHSILYNGVSFNNIPDMLRLIVGGSTQWFFDELRIFEGQLNLEQITALYNTGLGYANLSCTSGSTTTSSTTTTTVGPDFIIPTHYCPLDGDTYDYWNDADLGGAGTFNAYNNINGFTPSTSLSVNQQADQNDSTFVSGYGMGLTIFLRPVIVVSDTILITLTFNQTGTDQTLQIIQRSDNKLKIVWNSANTVFDNIVLVPAQYNFIAFKKLSSGSSAVSLNNNVWYNGPVIFDNSKVYWTGISLSNATFTDLRIYNRDDLNNLASIYNNGAPNLIPGAFYPWTWNYLNPIHQYQFENNAVDTINSLDLTAGVSTAYVIGAPKLGGKALRVGGSGVFNANYNANTGPVGQGIIDGNFFGCNQNNAILATWLNWGQDSVDGILFNYYSSTKSFIKLRTVNGVGVKSLIIDIVDSLNVSSSVTVCTVNNVSLPTWSHVCVRYNPKYKTIFVYFDSQCIYAQRLSKAFTLGTQQLVIGANSGAMPQCDLDDFRIYKRLRGQDVYKLFSGTQGSNVPSFPSTSYLVHHYRFFNNTFDSWGDKDLQVNANPVTYVSRTVGATTQVCGVQLNSLNSESIWYAVSQDGNFFSPGTDPFAIGFWFRIDNAPTFSGYFDKNCIFNLNAGNTATNDLTLTYDRTSIYFNNVKLQDYNVGDWVYVTISRQVVSGVGDFAIVSINQCNSYSIQISGLPNTNMVFGRFALGKSTNTGFGDISVSDIVFYQGFLVDLTAYFNNGLGTFADTGGEQAIFWSCGPHQYRLNNNGLDSNGVFDLTIGSSTSFVSGKINDALSVNDSVSFDTQKTAYAIGFNGDPFNSQTGNYFSLAFWFKYDVGVTNSGTFLSIFNSSVGDSVPTIAMVTDDVSFDHVYFLIDSLQTPFLNGMSAGTWFHVVITYNFGNYTIYLNGAVSNSMGVNRPTAIPNTIVLGAPSGPMPLVAFDDVRTYGVTLTGWDVLQLYNSGSGTEASCGGTTTTTVMPTTSAPPIPTTYLTHYWKFNENTYDYWSVNNSTGGQDWLIISDPKVVSDYTIGKYNYAFSTYSTYHSGLVYDCEYFSRLINNAYSWAFWLRIDQVGSGAILSNAGSFNIELNYRQNGSTYDLYIGDNIAFSGLDYIVWNSIIVSVMINGSTVTVTVFVNNRNPVSFIIEDTELSLGAVYIGQRLDHTQYSDLSIDELRFYDIYLTTVDALSYFNNGNGYEILLPCNTSTTSTTSGP